MFDVILEVIVIISVLVNSLGGTYLLINCMRDWIKRKHRENNR